MSCNPIETGNHFMGSMLAHVDCQAQTIGAYGYGALVDPGSPVMALLQAALSLFIAFYGFRLMFGERPSGRDLVGAMLKIGIVLTLATSWPTWRNLAFGFVLAGPAEIAGPVGTASGLPGSGSALDRRLDSADQGIIALTAFGTGRLTGGVTGGADLGDSARGIALADQSGFAWGRVVFLAGTIGPLALVRLSGGILLALAPLMAGLLLFAGTRDIFMGWLRALGACALGAVVLALCYGAELAVLESWLRDTLGQRQANVLTPAAPTELLVIALAFAIVAFGALGLVVRLMFFAAPMWQRLWHEGTPPLLALRRPDLAVAGPGMLSARETGRVERIADAVAQTIRREERLADRTRIGGLTGRGQVTVSAGEQAGRATPLGSSFRRGYHRHSSAAAKRDDRQ